MGWIQLKLDLPQDKMEEISGYLFAHGCEGINLENDSALIYFSSHRWSNEIRLAILEYIQEIVPFFSARNIKIIQVSDQDWNKNWKNYFRPIHVTSRIVIKPPWEEYREREKELLVTINPQMAFGTGHHESTQLMIRTLEKWIKPGMHVMDVGTGSGILAIIAEKLGAESVIAFDDDPVALKNAIENARLNSVSEKVNFFLARPENLRPSEYELVLANINRNVLKKYASLFTEFISEGGKLIISGILIRDESIIRQHFEKVGFQLVEKATIKEWLLIVFELKSKINEKDQENVNHESHSGNTSFWSNEEDEI